MSNINPEKRRIIEQSGNLLVVANPGTGKTLLLAYKYIDLIKKGLKPEEILCLTFTNKAKREMEDRIIKIIKEENINVDFSKLNIFTFHSYCMDKLDDSDIISSNLLRYTIYKYLTDNNVLNYGDDYLVETIVPKMENLIRYLKSFGVKPKNIDVEAVKPFIEDDDKFEKADLERFLVEFVKIYHAYEKAKEGKGCDYADLLLDFLELKKKPRFKFVLVDELQDVNKIEADIALLSADNFFAVGDPKQAIFGFQGGSILNFEKFKDSTQFILSENFRSTNQVLEYVKKDFISKTKDSKHKNALKDLKNADGKTGDKPFIVEASKDEQASIILEIIKQTKDDEKIAVIARTNYQLMRLAKELESLGVDLSSTFYSASTEAKDNIIVFIKGILSDDINEVKNAMFTPFFPITLQEAFKIGNEKKLTIEQLYEKIPEFKKIKDEVRTIEDLNNLFKQRIIPVAFSYGEEYVLATTSVQESCIEAIKLLNNKTIKNLLIYLNSSDLTIDSSSVEKRIILTTVHKSKGKEYDNAIYVPSKTTNRTNFQDRIVEAILKSKNIDAKEELEEETLRVNFVAYTRAKKKLWVLTEKPQDHLNDEAEVHVLTAEAGNKTFNSFELKKRAFALFVNGQFDEAKKALETNDAWLLEFVKKHFDNLDRISFSRLDSDAYEYFLSNILNISEFTDATILGSDVHDIIEKILKNEEYVVLEEATPYVENAKEIINDWKSKGYVIKKVEYEILQPLKDIMETNVDINFKGVIDAVFERDGEVLIVDWKTSKNSNYSADYRQQLETYKRIYAVKENISLDKIKVAIAYIGLRKPINDGCIDGECDEKQPAKSSFETMKKKLNVFLEWKKNPKAFLEQMKESEKDDPLIRSVKEQIRKEI